MKALSLFAVFAVAKIAILFGHHIPRSLWTPVVYLWQDAAVALVFGVFEFVTRGGRWLWLPYVTAVVYAAINVPLTRVVSSPMTWPMLGAARGTLGDSIRHHATWQSAFPFSLVLFVGALFPILLRHVSARIVAVTAVIGLILACAGFFAGPRVETAGLHRNALFAFVSSTMPQVRARRLEADWRHSPFEAQQSEPLLSLRGAASGRNVIIIVLESTGAAHLKSYGASLDPMPALTKLSETAIIFENAYAVYPESIKALIPLLWSRFPAFDTSAETHANIATVPIAKVLAREGYRSALFHSGRFIYLGMDEVVKNSGFETSEDAGQIGGNVNSSFGVDEPATISRMLAWIDALNRNERFFVVYLPIAGHHPYETPEPRPFPEREEIDRYRNALFFGDSALATFFAELKERGLFEKTLFIIFGDHGEAFGQHEGNYGHTMFLYEENVRVPFLLAIPGRVSEQIRVSRVASVIDTSPTILDLLGLPIPTAFQGSSLLDPTERMALLFTDYSIGFFGLRDGGWKFIDEPGASRPKLFQLSQDPQEKRNVASEFAERATIYRRILSDWSSAQKELIRRGN